MKNPPKKRETENTYQKHTNKFMCLDLTSSTGTEHCYWAREPDGCYYQRALGCALSILESTRAISKPMQHRNPQLHGEVEGCETLATDLVPPQSQVYRVILG